MGTDLVNTFSWSKSRHQRLSECARAYYFQYYASWGGWAAYAPARVRALYALKKLHNRFTWAGDVVHQAIRDALLRLRSGRSVDGAAAIDQAHRRMRREFAHSKALRHRQDLKTFAGLAEHEYAEGVPDEAWQANWGQVRAGLEWFFASRWPRLAAQLGEDQWLEVDEADFDASTFELDGVKVFGLPDFAFRDEDGLIRVVDWKTGKPHDGYDDQVVCYALYLLKRYGLDLERARCTLVYVNSGSEHEVVVTAAAVDRFKARFAQSVAQMRALLSNPMENAPHPESAFPLAEDRSRCQRCVYRRVCPSGAGAAT